MTEDWIVYKTETMSDHGWEERKILPSGSITDILWENWSFFWSVTQSRRSHPRVC